MSQLLRSIFTASLCPLVAVAQSAVATLTAAQLAAIDGGGRVVMTRDRPESSWPAVTVVAYIDATPEEAAAAFTDYERHSSYIPSVKYSRISRVIDATTAEVDYIVGLPIVRDERYTVRDRLSADDSGGFRLDWTLVRATSTKATVGHARFTPHTNARTGHAGALIEYHNFVTPGSRLASLGFIRTRAIRQVEETVRAIARQTEADLQRPGALNERVAALRAALACASGATPVTGKC
jgi:hypothetical protein